MGFSIEENLCKIQNQCQVTGEQSWALTFKTLDFDPQPTLKVLSEQGNTDNSSKPFQRTWRNCYEKRLIIKQKNT